MRSPSRSVRDKRRKHYGEHCPFHYLAHYLDQYLSPGLECFSNCHPYYSPYGFFFASFTGKLNFTFFFRIGLILFMKIVARTTASCAPKIGAIALECKLFIIIIIQRSCHSSICRRRTSLQQRQKLALGRVEKACESSRVFRIVRMCTGHERNHAVHVHVLKCSRVNGRIARI